MYDYPDELDTLSPDLLWSMLNINMGSVTMMTRMLVNDMKKRGKGAIVNISSGSELQPLPYAAVYGASKVITPTFPPLTFSHLDLHGFMCVSNRSFSQSSVIFQIASHINYCYYINCYCVRVTFPDLCQEFHIGHSA